MKKIIMTFATMVTIIVQIDAAPLSDELVVLHNITTAEMNAITTPLEGSLVFNTDDNEVYERNATAWHRISSDGSDTKVLTDTCVEIVGTGTSVNPYIINNSSMGKTQATAGLTCMKMLETGCVRTDGMYWINPDGGNTSNAFEVYCDMTGGGWTKIEYTADLDHIQHFTGGDADRWLPTNFSLALTDTQINDIRAISTEGKQHYHGSCQGVIHHLYKTNNYTASFGFRFHGGGDTSFDQQSYPNTNVLVTNDGCVANDGTLRSTGFDIFDLRVPIINIHSRDNGNNNEKFGSPLTNNPAWLR